MSILDVLDMLKVYGIEILKRIWVLAILSVVMVYVMKSRTAGATATYTASVSFQLNEQTVSGPKSNPLFDYMSNVNISLEKMMEMMKSRRLMKKALFTKIKVDETGEDYMANHFYRLVKKSDFRFKSDSISDLDESLNGRLNVVIDNIRKKMLTYKISQGEVVTITLKGTDEKFTYYMLIDIYKTLADDYISLTTERQRHVFEILTEQVKRLEGQLNGTEIALANDYDSHLQSVRFKEEVRQGRTEREVQILREAYYEAKQSLQTATMSLETSVPLIQPIDEPVLPLLLTAPSSSKAVPLGILIGVVLGSVLVVARKFFADLLRREREKRKKKQAKQAEKS